MRINTGNTIKPAAMDPTEDIANTILKLKFLILPRSIYFDKLMKDKIGSTIAK
jgi:hypothetical protein